MAKAERATWRQPDHLLARFLWIQKRFGAGHRCSGGCVSRNSVAAVAPATTIESSVTSPLRQQEGLNQLAFAADNHLSRKAVGLIPRD